MGVRRIANQVSINLAANIAQGVLALALVRLATRVLGPEDYGVYGMAMVIVALVVALCETGAAYVLYGNYSELPVDGRRGLLATLILLSSLTGTLAAYVLWILWPVLARFGRVLGSLDSMEILLICLAIPLRTVWAIVNPILIVQKRSHWVAASIASQSVATFAVVLVALYSFDQNRAALFWGNLAGALACLVTALFAVGGSAWGRPSMQWLRKVTIVAPRAWLAGLAENVRATVESGAVARATGSAGLGNYNHAKSYHGLLMQGSNAFANVLWPVALQEARDRESQFVRIRAAWDIVYVGLTLSGLVFVFFGESLILWLTNDKFVEAATWVPFLVMYLLIQNSGKPATAVLFASNLGNTYSMIRIVSVGLAITGIVILVPRFGIPAAIAVAIFEIVITRVLAQVIAGRLRPTPVQDQWVIGGCAVIGAAWALLHKVTLTGAVHVALFLSVSVLLLFVAERSISAYSDGDSLERLRGLFKVKRKHV